MPSPAYPKKPETRSYIDYKKSELFGQLLSSIEEQENQGGLCEGGLTLFDSREEAEAFERRYREKYGRDLPDNFHIIIGGRINKPDDSGL